MNPRLAALLVFALIAGLFYLDRDRRSRVSSAIWLPLIWLTVAMSRSVSGWALVLGFGGETNLDAAQANAEGSPLDRYVLTAFIVLGTKVLISRYKEVLRIVYANKWIFLYALYCGMSVAWSDFPEIAIKRWIRMLGHIGMVLIVLTEVDPVAAVKRLLSGMAFLLIPLSILFIRYYPEFGRYYDPFIFHPSPSGVTSNKNELGMLCMVCGLGAAWKLMLEFKGIGNVTRLRRCLGQGILLALIVWLLLGADSATSSSCLVLGSCLMVLLGLRLFKRKASASHALMLPLITATYSVLFMDSLGGMLSLVGRNATLTGRTEIWDLVLKLSGSPWFGVGYASFWLGPRLKTMWDTFWYHPVQAHNGYLEMYLNIGWVGLASFAMVILSGYRSLTVKNLRDQDLRRLQLAFFLVVMIYNATEAAFDGPMWFIFLLGLMFTTRRTSSHESASLSYTSDSFADEDEVIGATTIASQSPA